MSVEMTPVDDAAARVQSSIVIYQQINVLRSTGVVLSQPAAPVVCDVLLTLNCRCGSMSIALRDDVLPLSAASSVYSTYVFCVDKLAVMSQRGLNFTTCCELVGQDKT